MKIVYIHAGLPKNGSSALQVFFAKHVKELYAEDVEYFELESLGSAEKGEITSGNGALLSRSMLNENHEAYYSDDQIYKKFLNLIKLSDKKIGLISSEFFVNISMSRLEKLKADLDRLNVILKFIFYVRRQDQYLMSGYMQRVKRHCLTLSPKQYISDTYEKVHFLKYYGYTKQLENILGGDNIEPFIFESTKEHPKGLIGHFMNSLLGKCPEWVKQNPIINTSPSILEVKFLLMANQFSPRMKFSDFVVEDSILVGRSMEYKTHSILEPEFVEEILNFFSVQNENFEKQYGRGMSFPKYKGGDYVDLDDFSFSTNDLMDILTGFLVRYDRRLAKLESSIKK